MPIQTQETQEMRIRSLCWEDPLEKEMVTHSSILAWKIPWTEEPGDRQSTESNTTEHTAQNQNIHIILINLVIR